MRVNVETRALAESRFYNLMKTLKWNRSRTIGVLLLLWHDSQELLKTSATRKEIISWLDAESPEEAELIFDALLTWNYLSAKKGGFFLIHGNEKHVTFLANRRRAGLLGGVASGKARQIKDKEASASTWFKNVNPMHYNAMQSKEGETTFGDLSQEKIDEIKRTVLVEEGKLK